jgi:hypothetical protein
LTLIYGKLVKYYIWSLDLCGAETWALRKVDQNSLESFEMWCWRRMEIIWTNRARNEEALHRFKEERNILRAIKRREANLDWPHLA